ncbi:MAG: hypothetical protein JRM72_02050 [Nitrososphaerota archaeon]|nr:hypothetical protein [Nitrososphaerota archaeon]MDG7036150.1 hypothetical protein [Nitrososphaerota archaeon]
MSSRAGGLDDLETSNKEERWSGPNAVIRGGGVATLLGAPVALIIALSLVINIQLASPIAGRLSLILQKAMPFKGHAKKDRCNSG